MLAERHAAEHRTEEERHDAAERSDLPPCQPDIFERAVGKRKPC